MCVCARHTVHSRFKFNHHAKCIRPFGARTHQSNQRACVKTHLIWLIRKWCPISPFFISHDGRFFFAPLILCVPIDAEQSMFAMVEQYQGNCYLFLFHVSSVDAHLFFSFCQFPVAGIGEMLNITIISWNSDRCRVSWCSSLVQSGIAWWKVCEANFDFWMIFF